MIFQFVDEKCQYWLNETAQTLTSPNFDLPNQKYDHNLECMWIISADIGSYITLEIHNFYVKTNLLTYVHCTCLRQINVDEVLVTQGHSP